MAGLAGRLREEGGGRWLVHCEDAYAFAVALFAVAHAGALAVLLPEPPAGHPGARGAPRPGRAARRRGARARSRSRASLDPLDDAALGPPAELRPLELRAPLLELSTSGTTGEGKQVPKALRHLEAEVAVLEASFGAGARRRRRQVFATASPQHLYGLLFRVLWPLAAGRPFHGPTYLHAEELLPRIEEAGDALLASTPAHLSRVAGLGARARRLPRGVLLGRAARRRDGRPVREALGRAPIEVFGSTETGGVAWRRQEPGPARLALDAAARACASSAVAEGEGAGRLRVRSPFVSAGGEDAGGAASLHDGRPRRARRRTAASSLLGRADRVVKIGEKRLSLPEMESQLRAHPFVSEAALLALEQGGETRVAAAVVLSEAGRRGPRRMGAAARCRRASPSDLAHHWDRVLLPRAWRYVEALPRDAQGKTPAAPAARALRGLARRPLVLAETRGPRSLARELSVPDDLVFLEGHFDGFPVVPGVVAARLGDRRGGGGPRRGAARSRRSRT